MPHLIGPIVTGLAGLAIIAVVLWRVIRDPIHSPLGDEGEDDMRLEPAPAPSESAMKMHQRIDRATAERRARHDLGIADGEPVPRVMVFKPVPVLESVDPAHDLEVADARVSDMIARDRANPPTHYSGFLTDGYDFRPARDAGELHSEGL